jgi:predicted CopG family antitoxin
MCHHDPYWHQRSFNQEKTMGSKQTRRAISISGKTYEKLKATADAQHKSMSGIVEEALELWWKRHERAVSDDHLSENTLRG